MSSATDWMTLAQVEEITGMKERKIRSIVRKHGVPVLKDGYTLRFDERSLLELKEAMRQPSRVERSKARANARRRDAMGKAMEATAPARLPRAELEAA